MSLGLWFYLIDVSQGFSIVFIAIAMSLAVIGLVSFLEESKNAKYVIVVSICSAFISILIPSKQAMYVMLGTSVAEDMAKNPKVQEFGERLLNIINSKLDEIEESSHKKSK